MMMGAIVKPTVPDFVYEGSPRPKAVSGITNEIITCINIIVCSRILFLPG